MNANIFKTVFAQKALMLAEPVQMRMIFHKQLHKICNKNIGVLFFLLLLIITNIHPVHAEEMETGAIELRKIIIRADKEDKEYQTGAVALEETSSFISVIDVENFEGRIDDVSDVIEDEAAIQTRQIGGLGNYSTVSLRGSTSEQVLVFIDGVLLNDATGGGVNLSEISISDIESIEIFRGATPVQFGVASIGGVINIKTRRSKKGFNASAGIGYGSFDTRKASVFLNQKIEGFDYVVIADYLSSNNDYKFLNDNQTPYNKDDDFWDKMNNNELCQGNMLTKAGYDFTKDIRIDISNQYFSKDRNLPGWDNDPAFNTSYNTDRNITNLKFTVNNISQYKFNTAILSHYSYKRDEYDDRYNQVGYGKQHIKYLTVSYGSNLFFEWPAGFNDLIAVLSANREEMESKNLLKDSPYRYYPCSRTTYAGAVEDTISILNETLIMRPTIRYQRIYDETESGHDFDGMAIEGTSDSRGAFSPQLGIRYLPLAWLAAKTNIAKYIRDPSIFEIYGDRGSVKGNKYLKSEQGINFDIGVEIFNKFDNDYFNRINFSTAFFKSKVENTIIPDYFSTRIIKYQNADSDIYGIENSLSIDLLKHFTLSGNLTWQETKNINKYEAFDGKQLPGIFEFSTFSKIEFKFEFFKLFCEYRYETDMYYDRANLLPADDKKELNTGSSIVLGSFRISLEIKNIEDNRYEDFSGYPAPGRSYNGALKYSLEF